MLEVGVKVRRRIERDACAMPNRRSGAAGPFATQDAIEQVVGPLALDQVLSRSLLKLADPDRLVIHAVVR
jgi:hypothetical protein